MDISEIICVNSSKRYCGVGSYASMLEELLGTGKLITLVFDKEVRNDEYPGKVFHGIYPPISTGWTLNTTFCKQIYRVRGFRMPKFVHLVDLMTLYPSRKQRGIVTIHDVNYLRRANASVKYINKMLQRLINWDYVLADSYATKNDLLKQGFSEDQIKVIHLGVREDKWFKMEAREQIMQQNGVLPALRSPSKPIVLTIGDGPHKNVELTHESVKHDYFHIHIGKNQSAHISLYGIDGLWDTIPLSPHVEEIMPYPGAEQCTVNPVVSAGPEFSTFAEVIFSSCI